MREKTPFILTAVGLVAILALLMRDVGDDGSAVDEPVVPRPRGDRAVPASDEPRDEIDELVSAHFQLAKKGDVEGYVSCFSQELRARLDEAIADVGREAFATDLIAVGQQPKGITTSHWAVEEDGRTASARVELVFRDRDNEVQDFGFVREGGRWRISSMSEVQYVKMPIPYGTPAYPLGTPEAGEDGAETSPPE